MAKRVRTTYDYAPDQVWAAAVMAYRVNGGFVKTAQIQDGRTVRPANRDLVRQFLAQSEHGFTRGDIEQGRRCRQDLANVATVAALMDRSTEWDHITARMANLDRVTSDYEISVIASMPKSHAQNLARASVDSRLRQCASDAVGVVDQVVNLRGEVVRCVYSANWNTFYVTVITDDNHQVFFAYRERIDAGRRVAFRGRVKRHADSATQLSRVKILEQEVV